MPTGRQYSTANVRAVDDSIFPPKIEVMGRTYLRQPMRYGDNPHQAACVYVPVEVEADFLVVGGLKELKTGKSGLSVTNTKDIDRALRVLKYCREESACAVMKHLNPSGVAKNSSQGRHRNLAECFNDAWLGDPIAGFGGVAAFTRPVDRETAKLIQDGKHYIEVVAAPDFEEGVMGIFENTYISGGAGKSRKVNPSMRVVKVENLDRLPRFEGDSGGHLEITTLEDGTLVLQEPYLTRIRGRDNLNVVSEANVLDTDRGMEDDALFSWYIAQGVRSNGVVLVEGGQAIATGTGQQERVRSVRYAIRLAEEKGHSLSNSTLASDGFIPFRDSIDACALKGVTVVVEPGESARDAEVIAACNEHGMTLAFTGERCFAHF